MTTTPDLEALARQLAERHGSKGAWVLLFENERGEVKAFGNVGPTSVRALAKRYERQERERT